MNAGRALFHLQHQRRVQIDHDRIVTFPNVAIVDAEINRVEVWDGEKFGSGASYQPAIMPETAKLRP